MTTSAAQHYKDQRDTLAYYLLDHIGLSRAQVARILNITRSAVSLQFPTKKGAK